MESILVGDEKNEENKNTQNRSKITDDFQRPAIGRRAESQKPGVLSKSNILTWDNPYNGRAL